MPEQLDIHWQEVGGGRDSDLSLTCYAMINRKWIMGVNVKYITI